MKLVSIKPVTHLVFYVSIFSALSFSNAWGQENADLLRETQLQTQEPGSAAQILSTKVATETQSKGFSSALAKEFSKFRVSWTIDILGNAEFDSNGVDGRSYYQFVVEPSFKNNEQIRTDTWVVDLKAGWQALSVGPRVKITFVRYFSGKDAKWDALKASVKWPWELPLDTNDIKTKMKVNEGFRYEFVGDLSIGKGRSKDVGSFTSGLSVSYARQGVLLLDLHKFTETAVRSRFIGIKNRGELRVGLNANLIDGSSNLPGKLKDWMSFGVGGDISASVASFGQPVGIDSVLMDQLFRFSTKDKIPVGELRRDEARGEAALEEIFVNIRNGKLPWAFIMISTDTDLLKKLEQYAPKALNMAREDYQQLGASQAQKNIHSKARVINLFRGRTETGLYQMSARAKMTGLLGGSAQTGQLISYVTAVDAEDKLLHYWLDSNFTYQNGRALFGRTKVDVLKDLDVMIQSDSSKSVGDVQDVVVRTQVRDTGLREGEIKNYRTIVLNSLPEVMKKDPKLDGLLKAKEMTNANISIRKAYGHHAFVSIGSLDRPRTTMKMIEFFENHPFRKYMRLPSDLPESTEGLGTFAEQKAHELADIFEPSFSEAESLQAYRVAKRDPLFEAFIIPDFLATLLPENVDSKVYRIDINVSSGEAGASSYVGGDYKTSSVFDAVAFLRTVLTNQQLDTREMFGVDVRTGISAIQLND